MHLMLTILYQEFLVFAFFSEELCNCWVSVQKRCCVCFNSISYCSEQKQYGIHSPMGQKTATEENNIIHIQFIIEVLLLKL